LFLLYFQLVICAISSLLEARNSAGAVQKKM